MSTTISSQSPRADRELIPAESPLSPYVSVNPARMSGEPVFRGTRVPVQTLFDHLSAGDTLDDFLEGFDGVSRDQATAVIGLASLGMLEGLRRL